MEENTPVLLDVETIVRKEQAKVKQAKLIRKVEVKTMVKDMIGMVVARSEVDKVMEEVLSKCTWIASIGEVWRLLQDDQPLQEAVKKKMARQELDLKVAFEEMEKDDRLQRVSYLRKEFAVARAETEMVSLEEMMSCLEMTMMAETRVEVGMMCKDWHEDEEMEHLEMDRLLTDNDGAKDVTEGEDDRVIDMELEHEYLDGVLEEWSQRMEVMEHI